MTLHFGNPLRSQRAGIMKSALLSELVEKGTLEEYLSHPPRIDYAAEIGDMITLSGQVSAKRLMFIEACEESLYQVFSQSLSLLGIEESASHLESIIKPFEPVLMYAKYHFNVPRPYQMAFELGLPLYPSIKTDACSPAAPSGHAFESMLIADYLGDKYPQLSKVFYRIAGDITLTREEGGLHYASDKVYSKTLFQVLKSNGYLPW